MHILDGWSARSARRLGATRVFRPLTGLVITGLWMVATAGWVAAAAAAGPGSLLGQLPSMLVIGCLVYAGGTRPLVAVGPDGVLLRNAYRDVRVPWSALAAVDTRYALTLTTGAGQHYRAWAAPAPSRLGAARATPSDLRAVGWDPADGPIPASATVRSDAGAAAALIRRLWDPTSNTPDATSRAEVRWASGILLGTALAAAATGVTALLTR